MGEEERRGGDDSMMRMFYMIGRAVRIIDQEGKGVRLRERRRRRKGLVKAFITCLLIWVGGEEERREAA